DGGADDEFGLVPIVCSGTHALVGVPFEGHGGAVHVGTVYEFTIDPALKFNGTPAAGNFVNYTVNGLHCEAGHLAVVLLSCTGTSGFPLPDGRLVPLTFDGCTTLGLALVPFLSATIDVNGVASTPLLLFPSVPAGITIYSAALSVDTTIGSFIS